jgi:Phage tail lysozyme
MAGKVNGFAVAYTAFGGLLIYSGIKGTSLTATFTDLTKGKLNSTPEASAAAAGGVTASTTAASSSANANYLTIGKFLVQNGYTPVGAAGVVGCIAGESGGDPEAEATPGNPSGGAGLIQWTGSSYSAFPAQITGNASADLDQQLPLILAYNNAQGGNYVAMLNAQPDPVSAADFYSRYFERPAVANSDVRAGVANAVYSELISSGVAA